MAKKTHNAILEEQRRARQEFLDLKKMQNGEMDAGPKPSEVAIVPKTFGEKVKNIWFHDKWYILGFTAVIILIVTMVAQCATKEKFDLKAVIFSYDYIGDEYLEPIAKYLEQYCEDIDGNGEVNIQVINCSYNKKGTNPQMQMTMSQKLTSIIAADSNALLFITNDESYEYLNNITENAKMFEGDPVVLGEDFYEKCKSDDPIFKLPEGLRLSCRDVSGKTISKDDNVKTYYEVSKKILEAVAEKNK